ncbi:beta-N-acetylhexosaminidase [Thiocapsa imhoffii]|uniref:Beta-hexosaminidase n=1 Tax=Thiocapsa imhoffii TaxID=382777 RepID=A0A9X0WHQ8_9GAMM|nr:beta-N-acetylhexosaminidase [Thiocapsa imhoffii]MBK1644741.1 beta-N-acetylhexosaminidase [Thiocapsa imhoffii]
MALGSVMLDLAGTVLTAEDRDVLRHPAVGGVILFARNYASPAQLARLTAEIHALREPRLLIGVDQEGGRVQRFRDGFTRLPPAGRFALLHAARPREARAACEAVAWLMASELRAVGIDFSFAPVLDLDRGLNAVVGDRAFGSRPRVVAELGLAWLDGVRRAGMAAVGKHFPGHGGVAVDSHQALPVDPRADHELLSEDLIPFERLIAHALEAIMPAHVCYPRVDGRPAGFSPVWLRDILRGRLGFQGVIFSDDLSMGAAASSGAPVERAEAAVRAGCDMLLVCNDRASAIEVLDAFVDHQDPAVELRLLRMHGRGGTARERLHEDPAWQRGIEYVAMLEGLETLDLDLLDPTDPEALG